MCPRCGQRSTLRLFSGEACVDCQAQVAWRSYEHDKLVITGEDIRQAHARRTGAGAAGRLRRFAWWGLAVASVALAAASLGALFHIFASVAVGPLESIIGEVRARAMYALGMGLATFVAVSALLLWTRRHRRIRSPIMLAGHVCAVLAGATAAVVGGLGVLASNNGVGFLHTRMPPIGRDIGRGQIVQRIMGATVVVLAPDGDGDAKSPALGTGIVIARTDGAAWIVTNRHVAMPYADVGSFRRASDARRLWVEFADGRGRHGRVRWVAPPPIDVALVQVKISAPPQPVFVAGDANEVVAGKEVTFVPNPYRNGWLVHRGVVLKREAHSTPAGEYSIVYSELPVQPGDSGSGLFNEFGELVGINTWSIRGAAPRGISLPSETMRAIVDAIKKQDLDVLTAREGDAS